MIPSDWVRLTTSPEPQTFDEAVTCKESKTWEKAIDEELNQLLHHKTWEDCNEIPKGVKPIQCRWVFKIKHEPDGNVRHKARLVVKGYTQRKGLDYQETYAPVVRADTLRLLLGLSIYDRDIQVHVMDVVTAFLNGRIKERIYMEVPQGYKSKAQCVRLLGSLYGLKQDRQFSTKPLSLTS